MHNIIRALTWLHSENRLKIQINGETILIASAEDLYNALSISEEIFNQSLSGLEPRLKDILDKYDEVVVEGKALTVLKNSRGFADIDTEGYDWVNRKTIQDKLEIKSRDTMRKHVKELCDMGLLVYENRKSRSYIARRKKKDDDDVLPANLPANHRLITGERKTLYNAIHSHEKELIEHSIGECLAGSSPVISRWLLEEVKNPSALLSLRKTYRRILPDIDKPVKKSDEIKAEIRKFAGSDSPVGKKPTQTELENEDKRFDLVDDNCISQLEEVQKFISYVDGVKDRTGVMPSREALNHTGYNDRFIDEMINRNEVVEVRNGLGGKSIDVI